MHKELATSHSYLNQTVTGDLSHAVFIEIPSQAQFLLKCFCWSFHVLYVSVFWLDRCGSYLNVQNLKRCYWCYYKCTCQIKFHVFGSMKCFIFNLIMVWCYTVYSSNLE